MSLLTQERGLKGPQKVRHLVPGLVAPHVGAWIERATIVAMRPEILVAPHAGAWIESNGRPQCKMTFRSRSSRRSVD